MKRFISSRKRIAMLMVTLAVVGASAFGAYAYWTQGGTGTGSATTGTTSAIAVNQTSVTASTLYPGGPVEALSGNFDNNNPGGVHITSVTAAVTGVTPLAGNTFADNGKPDCTTADFYITGSFGPYTVPAGGAGVGAWSGLNIGLANRNGVASPPSQLSPAANQDNCKGASATITYTANP
jgi:hypothetical protein